jgi:molecular chaperone DnaK (HSP70)
MGARARICIDLGTALSKVCAYLGQDTDEKAAVAPLPIGAVAGAEHALMTPSALFVDDDRVLFGPAAIERARVRADAKRSPVLSFKMVLSARAIGPAMEMKPCRSIDPTGTLRHRDMLVLYLAHLDQLIRAAIATEAHLPAVLADAPRRLTSPHWQAYNEAADMVGHLVEEAALVSEGLGNWLRMPEGVPLTLAKEQLERAAANAPIVPRWFDGVVFEGDSAASAYAYFARQSSPLVLVVDMGAGTTDMVGFEWDAAARQLREISGTRQCSVLAGDEVDNIVIEAFMRASRQNTLDEREKLWRALRLAAPALKREIFSRDKAVFELGRKRWAVSHKTISEDDSFKAFCTALTAAAERSLQPMLARAKVLRADTISLLLAGGGAGLPFLPDLMRAAAPRKGVKLAIERFGSNWSLPHMHHPLAGMAPQMAIALGGALAPVARAALPAAPAA